MTASPKIASDRTVEARAKTVPVTGPFVLNLCSSSTPMALAQTELPELKRFSFFVSRRFEEGRERFRLHMGHFATLAEAEEWLAVVREIYPGAWAGEAPGRKLRERAAAAAAAQAQYAAGPQPVHAPAARGAAPLQVPVVHAAPPVAQAAAKAATPAKAPAPKTPAAHAKPASNPARGAQTAPAASKAPKAAPDAAPARAAIAKAATARAAPLAKPAAPQASAAAIAPKNPPAAEKTALVPAILAAPLPQKPAPATPKTAAASERTVLVPAIVAPPAAAKAAAPPAARPAAARAAAKPAKPVKPVFEDSNVREVLKALGDQHAGETREMRVLPAPPPAAEAGLTDTQVLKMLETRRAEHAQPLPVENDSGNIPLLKPDDTGTRRALKDAVTSNAPVAFAVQLQWSVQPPDLESVPPLAIFSAYTLYTVEGSRDGRKWYGLRLGFFTDAISAKQVAHYVRSEFASVAVVPVSPGEKARASDQDVAATLVGPAPARSDPMDEFKLIDESESARVAAAAEVAARGAVAAKSRVPMGRALREAGAPRARAALSAPERRCAHSLEETLEILGAGQLSIDNGNGTTLNDSGVRHLHVEVQKNSPFSKLLERLSERLKKG
jgi:hypothetical protein